MKRFMVLAMTACAVVTSLTVGSSGAQAAATKLLVDWEMNEPAGATTMIDSGPLKINGNIGTDMTTGVTTDGATGYSWSAVKPNQTPVDTQRLVQVPNDDRLNAGSRDYAVTIRYKTIKTYGNIVQKGQNQTPGGYFKFENPGGFIHCLFKGSLTARIAKAPFATNDGNWHTIRCEKTSTGITMTIDGTTVVKSPNGNVGTISNTKPLTIAGKLSCDQQTVTCDYYSGNLDYVKIETS